MHSCAQGLWDHMPPVLMTASATRENCDSINTISQKYPCKKKKKKKASTCKVEKGNYLAIKMEW